MHNEVASAVMGCNTNVVPGVDGGSIIYCTLYVSKNEQKETKDNYARTAKKVLWKLIYLRDQENSEMQYEQQNQSTNKNGNNETTIGNTDCDSFEDKKK